MKKKHLKKLLKQTRINQSILERALFNQCAKLHLAPFFADALSVAEKQTNKKWKEQ